MMDSIRENTMRVALMMSFVLIAGGSEAQQLAFPGAEGFGKYASGGRGGHVVAVTNLEDNPGNPPEGSLRWALNLKLDTILHPVTKQPVAVFGPTTIVFRVSGIIELQGELTVKHPDLTIAGQTAPGDGICIKNFVMSLSTTENVILRYLRFRPGLDADSTALAKGVAGLDVENCRNIIVDHCSFSWANEECAIFYDNKYTTVQWCIASEGLYNAGHAKGSRSYCGVWGGQSSSIHHNLIAHNRSRTIRFNGSRAHDTCALVDYRNNVNYNWGSTGACYGGEVEIPGGYSRANMVNNYYKPGPATPSTLLFISPSYVTEGNSAYGVGQWYIDGNTMHSDAGSSDDNWLAVSLSSIPSGSRDLARAAKPFRVEEPVPTEPAGDAYQSVLEMAGAVFPRRDTVDARIIYEALNGIATGDGTIGKGIIDTPDSVGGYPEYLTYDVPDDVDQDGMDDAWELANSLDPADPDDRNNIHESGYTMLEMYLNGLVEDFTQILPPPVHVKGIADSYCAGSDPVSLLGSPRGGNFEGGTGFTVFADSVVFDPVDTGAYELKYVYSDGEGYADSVTETLIVRPLPEAFIHGLDTAYQVSNSYIQLSGEPQGGTWIAGEGTTLTPTGYFKPDKVGEHEIFYQYTDVYGCTVIVSATTTVNAGTWIATGPTLDDLKIFPNPAGDYIRISSPFPVSAVSIYSLAGVRLSEFNNPAEGIVNTGDLEGGIYYMLIKTDHGPAVRKFVKK